MADQMAFEARLAEAFGRYVAAAPIEVDAVAVAHEAAAAGAPSRPGARLQAWLPASRPVRVVVLATLLLALAASIVIVGSLLLRPPLTPLQLSTLPDMGVPRTDPIVVGLADGRVLVAGGQNSIDGSGPIVEILDPSGGSVTPITADTPFGSGVGVQLAGGRVFLIAFDSSHACSFAFVVDPSAATSHRVPHSGTCDTPPFGHHASLAALPDGRVLISGGLADWTRISRSVDNVARSAVLFDPRNDQFEATGQMTVKRIGHGMTVLRDGRVLVAGGSITASHAEDPVEAASWRDLDTLEIYDPATGDFTEAGAMAELRGSVAAVTLADGRVALVADQRHGSRDAQDQPASGPSSSIGPFPMEVYDPSTRTATVAGSIPHAASGAYLLRDGRVLVHGWVLEDYAYAGPGRYADHARAWAAMFDPSSGITTNLPAPRTVLSGSAVLSDGRVILVGGFSFPAPAPSSHFPVEPQVVSFVDLFE